MKKFKIFGLYFELWGISNSRMVNIGDTTEVLDQPITSQEFLFQYFQFFFDKLSYYLTDFDPQQHLKLQTNFTVLTPLPTVSPYYNNSELIQTTLPPLAPEIRFLTQIKSLHRADLALISDAIQWASIDSEILLRPALNTIFKNHQFTEFSARMSQYNLTSGPWPSLYPGHEQTLKLKTNFQRSTEDRKNYIISLKPDDQSGLTNAIIAQDQNIMIGNFGAYLGVSMWNHFAHQTFQEMQHGRGNTPFNPITLRVPSTRWFVKVASEWFDPNSDYAIGECDLSLMRSLGLEVHSFSTGICESLSISENLKTPNIPGVFNPFMEPAR